MRFKEKIERVFDMFDSSFIHREDELILHKDWNVYFLLPDIKDEYDFDYKLMSYSLFYVADNHFKKTSKQCKYFWNKLNRWFRKDFSYEQLQKMYTRLGNGANRSLGNTFIKSNFDFTLLDK